MGGGGAGWRDGRWRHGRWRLGGQGGQGRAAAASRAVNPAIPTSRARPAETARVPGAGGGPGGGGPGGGGRGGPMSELNGQTEVVIAQWVLKEPGPAVCRQRATPDYVELCAKSRSSLSHNLTPSQTSFQPWLASPD